MPGVNQHPIGHVTARFRGTAMQRSPASMGGVQPHL